LVTVGKLEATAGLLHSLKGKIYVTVVSEKSAETFHCKQGDKQQKNSLRRRG
jgi:hypothetical protein